MSDSLIRIAPGQKTAYELLSNDDYLVTNWARASDMPASISWSCSQPNFGIEFDVERSLGRGGGGYYGSGYGVISFFVQTPLMRKYLYETLMGSSAIAMITAYLHVPNGGFEFQEMQVVYAEIETAIARNKNVEYTRFSNFLYHTMQFEIRRAEILSLEVLQTIATAPLTTLDGKYLATLDQE